MFKQKKSLGQNFLHNKEISSSIVESLEINDGDIIIEIGPGMGALTQHISFKKNIKVFLIEIDSEICSIMEKKFQHVLNKKLFIKNLDALNILISDINNDSSKKVKIISNLPYNVSTIIYTNLLEQINNIDLMVLMFQKEVADRILSQHKSKNYGRLSIMTQLLCDVDRVLEVGSENFTPPPKVQSTVIKVKKQQNAILVLEDFKVISEFCKLCFSERRKKLKNNLIKKFSTEKIFKSFDKIQISKDSRIEDLSPQVVYNLFSILR